MEVIVVGWTVAVGVSEGVAVGVAGVAVGVIGIGEDVMEGDGVSVALGVGLDGGIRSTFLSIDLVDCAPFRFVVRISTWTG
jgi:hypothetical protein